MALAIQGYALQLGEFGLRSAATSEAIRTRGGARALVRRYLALRLRVSTVVVLAALGITAVLQPDHLGLMALALLSLFPVAFQLDWVSLVDGRNGWACVPLVVRPGVFVLVLLVWPQPLSASAIAWVFLGSWIAAALVSLIPLAHAPRVEGDDLPPPDRVMLSKGAGFTGVALLAQGQLSADLLMIGWSLGVDMAGVYYLASSMAVAGTVMANAAGQLALARMGASRGRADAIRDGAKRICVTGIVAGLAAAALLAVAAPWLLSAILGRQFSAAGSLLIWLAPWVVLVHLTTPLQAALGAAGRQRAALRANIAMVMALLPLLAVAAAIAEPWAFAMARSLAELVRLALLAQAAGLITTGDKDNAGGQSRYVQSTGSS